MYIKYIKNVKKYSSELINSKRPSRPREATVEDDEMLLKTN